MTSCKNILHGKLRIQRLDNQRVNMDWQFRCASLPASYPCRSRGEAPRERRVARPRQAARLVRSAWPREPNVRPDFLPRQSGVTRPLPGQKVGQLAVKLQFRHSKGRKGRPSANPFKDKRETPCRLLRMPIDSVTDGEKKKRIF